MVDSVSHQVQCVTENCEAAVVPLWNSELESLICGLSFLYNN